MTALSSNASVHSGKLGNGCLVFPAEGFMELKSIPSSRSRSARTFHRLDCPAMRTGDAPPLRGIVFGGLDI